MKNFSMKTVALIVTTLFAAAQVSAAQITPETYEVDAFFNQHEISANYELDTKNYEGLFIGFVEYEENSDKELVAARDIEPAAVENMLANYLFGGVEKIAQNIWDKVDLIAKQNTATNAEENMLLSYLFGNTGTETEAIAYEEEQELIAEGDIDIAVEEHMLLSYLFGAEANVAPTETETIAQEEEKELVAEADVDSAAVDQLLASYMTGQTEANESVIAIDEYTVAACAADLEE